MWYFNVTLQRHVFNLLTFGTLVKWLPHSFALTKLLYCARYITRRFKTKFTSHLGSAIKKPTIKKQFPKVCSHSQPRFTLIIRLVPSHYTNINTIRSSFRLAEFNVTKLPLKRCIYTLKHIDSSLYKFNSF